MRTSLRTRLLPLAAMAALSAGCKQGEPVAAVPKAVENLWKDRIKAAGAAFPETPIATCTTPVPRALLLSGSVSGGKVKRLSLCGTFGSDEVWRDYRPRERDSWQTRRIEGASVIVLFSPTKEVAPIVGAAFLTPGIVEGRAVVFSLEGVPQCEVAVHVEGPTRAESTQTDNIETVVKRTLCGLVTTAVSNALPKAPPK